MCELDIARVRGQAGEKDPGQKGLVPHDPRSPSDPNTAVPGLTPPPRGGHDGRGRSATAHPGHTLPYPPPRAVRPHVLRTTLCDLGVFVQAQEWPLWQFQQLLSS